jgi:hypothetical protein
MLADARVFPTHHTEQDLRRQIDRSVSRALADNEFAGRLLINPALALEERGCAPHQLKSLLSIRATTLTDFARQAQALFWVSDPESDPGEYPVLLAAAAR